MMQWDILGKARTVFHNYFTKQEHGKAIRCNGADLHMPKSRGIFLVSYVKAMVAYTKPQQRKKDESERLREEKDQIEFIDLRFGKARRRQDVT